MTRYRSGRVDGGWGIGGARPDPSWGCPDTEGVFPPIRGSHLLGPSVPQGFPQTERVKIRGGGGWGSCFRRLSGYPLLTIFLYLNKSTCFASRVPWYMLSTCLRIFLRREISVESFHSVHLGEGVGCCVCLTLSLFLSSVTGPTGFSGPGYPRGFGVPCPPIPELLSRDGPDSGPESDRRPYPFPESGSPCESPGDSVSPNPRDTESQRLCKVSETTLRRLAISIKSVTRFYLESRT